MNSRRIIRALARPVKRLIRPLRLRWNARQIEQSELQVEYLRELRAATIEHEQAENRRQVQLAVRRIELEHC